MIARRPSRVTMALLDIFAVDNEPLRGDLLEEFDSGRSQFWLLRQVVGAVLSRPNLGGLAQRVNPTMAALLVALIMLLALEAVFVTNLLHRLLFGRALPDVTGYLYFRTELPAAAAPPIDWVASVCVPSIALVISTAIGWVVAPFHARHRLWSLFLLSATVMDWTFLTMQTTFVVQYLGTMAFIAGLFAGGRLAANLSKPSVV